MNRILLLLFIAATGIPALACTFTRTDFTAGPSFRIAVSLPRSGPRPSHITLTRKGVAPISVPILENSVAFFRDVPPGNYRIEWDDSTGPEQQGIVRVRSSTPANQLLQLPPYYPPTRTTFLKGLIRSRSQEAVSLEVRRFSAGPVLRSTTTASTGAFDFANLPPGLYLLAIATPNPLLAGEIKILIDPAAASTSLDLELGASSCGPWIRDRARSRSKLD